MNILAILRLIRFPNLIIVAFTLYTIRYGVLQPILLANGMELGMDNMFFSFVVAGVMLIAAAGYMINDYFDVDTDNINRPDKVLVGKVFTPNSVFNGYVVLNILGLALIFIVSYKLKLLPVFWIFPLSVGMLWFYSTTYKHQLLLGNILISAFTAGVTVVPALFDLPVIFKTYGSFIRSEGLDFKYLYVVTGVFTGFAFMLNLIREIIKDMEDVTGDESIGCRTVPIVVGIKYSKIIVFALVVILIGSILFIYKKFLFINEMGKMDLITFWYFILLLIMPLVLSLYYLIKANESKDYSKSSLFLKMVMFFGLLYAWVLSL
jgi:4-hydroxybenzoate polyprenyltransferase